MAVDAHDELTLELARAAIAAASPGELPLLDAVGAELLLAAEARGVDGSLGFGVAEIAMSSAAILASRVVVDLAAEVARTMVTDEAAGFLRRIARTLRERRTGDTSTSSDDATLAPQHIDRARRLAYDRAIAVGVDDARAALLADAIAESFVVDAG